MKNQLFLWLLLSLVYTISYGQTADNGNLRLVDKQFVNSDSIHFNGKIETIGQTVIQSNTRVVLVSGQNIILGEGFEVRPGSTFTAIVRKSSDAVVQPAAAAVKKDLQDKDVVVFPNPTRDILHITSTRPILKLSITDVSGKVVRTVYPSAVVGSMMDINLSGEPAGLYDVYIVYPDGCLSRKVVLTK